MTAPTSPDQVRSRLAEWGIQLDPEIDYRLDSMFPKLDGFGAKGAVRKKSAIIRQIEPQLKRMLKSGEEVVYIAKGVQYSFAEQYFMGIWAATINHTVFVLTNLRLIMLRTNRNGKPKHTFWNIYYSQIIKFSGTWTGTLSVNLRDGKKLKFTGFPKLDRKQMGQVFEESIEAYRQAGFDPEVTQSMENLCSTCHAHVPKGEHECKGCGTTFWRPADVAARSLVFPSWGDIVMGHYTVAIIELIGYAFSWFIIAGLIAVGLEEGNLTPALIVAAIILFFAHGVDAMITYAVAKKGLHPRSRPLPEKSAEYAT